MTTSDQQIVNLTTDEISKLLEGFAEAQRLSDLDALSQLLTRRLQTRRPTRIRRPQTAVARAVPHRSAPDRVTRVGRGRHPHVRLREFRNRDRQADASGHL